MSNLPMTGLRSDTVLCGIGSLPAGSHTLEIFITFPSPNPNFGFYLGYIYVTPAETQTIGAQENIWFLGDDSAIQASIHQADHDSTNQVIDYNPTKGSSFSFDFTGP